MITYIKRFVFAITLSMVTGTVSANPQENEFDPLNTGSTGISVGNVYYDTATLPISMGDVGSHELVITCPVGYTPTGGGYRFDDNFRTNHGGFILNDRFHLNSLTNLPDGWEVKFILQEASTSDVIVLRAYVACVEIIYD